MSYDRCLVFHSTMVSLNKLLWMIMTLEHFLDFPSSSLRQICILSMFCIDIKIQWIISLYCLLNDHNFHNTPIWVFKKKEINPVMFKYLHHPRKLERTLEIPNWRNWTFPTHTHCLKRACAWLLKSLLKTYPNVNYSICKEIY
jgi:hypothetical protein